MAEELLTQKQLARRWNISERTLERWRVIGHGPQFIKIGGHVRYRLSDIVAYEDRRLARSTKDSHPIDSYCQG